MSAYYSAFGPPGTYGNPNENQVEIINEHCAPMLHLSLRELTAIADSAQIERDPIKRALKTFHDNAGPLVEAVITWEASHSLNSALPSSAMAEEDRIATINGLRFAEMELAHARVRMRIKDMLEQGGLLRFLEMDQKVLEMRMHEGLKNTQNYKAKGLEERH